MSNRELLMEQKLRYHGQEWDIYDYHRWSDRKRSKQPFTELVRRGSKVCGIGSCFAEHVVKFIDKLPTVNAGSFNQARLYNPHSIYFRLKHLIKEPQYKSSDALKTSSGKFANLYSGISERFESVEQLTEWTETVDRNAVATLKDSDLVIITLGGTEVWRCSRTKRPFVAIPLPDVYNNYPKSDFEFYNLNYSETKEYLRKICELVIEFCPNSKILFTISPIRQLFTNTSWDVRVATMYAKSTLRAAVGDLVGSNVPKVHYFMGYELVSYSEFNNDLFAPDNAHVKDSTVRWLMHSFCEHFVEKSLLEDPHLSFEREVLLRDSSKTLQEISYYEPFDIRKLFIRFLRTANLDRLARLIYRRFVLVRQR